MQETHENWAVLRLNHLWQSLLPLGGVQWVCWDLLGCHVSPSFGTIQCYEPHGAQLHMSQPLALGPGYITRADLSGPVSTAVHLWYTQEHKVVCIIWS